MCKNHCKLPWFDKEAVKLRKKKVCAWRALRRSYSENRSVKYKRTRNRYNKLLRMKYAHHIKCLGEYVRKDPTKFWSFNKSKTEKESSHVKADVSNELFHSVFHKDTALFTLH